MIVTQGNRNKHFNCIRAYSSKQCLLGIEKSTANRLFFALERTSYH